MAQHERSSGDSPPGPSSADAVNEGRWRAIDAARGFAMLGVFVAHFGAGIRADHPQVASVLRIMGMYASPLFVLTSGAMLGYLLAALPGERRERMRIRLVDRGIFLLTAGHLALSLAFYLRYGDARRALVEVHITDAIGFAILVGALIAHRWPPGARLAVAAVAHVVGLLLAFHWHPADWTGYALKVAIAGDVAIGTVGRSSFPLIGWLALYLLGSVLGERLVAARRSGNAVRFGAILVGAGLGAVATSLLLKGAYYQSSPFVGSAPAVMSPGWRALYIITSPVAKYPPATAYFLAFGGLAIILLGCCLLTDGRRAFAPFHRWAAVMGQASFAVYVAQQYLLLVLLPTVRLQGPVAIGLAFVGATISLWSFAFAWRRWVGNAVLTVGLFRWWSTHRSRD